MKLKSGEDRHWLRSIQTTKVCITSFNIVTPIYMQRKHNSNNYSPGLYIKKE